MPTSALFHQFTCIVLIDSFDHLLYYLTLHCIAVYYYIMTCTDRLAKTNISKAAFRLRYMVNSQRFGVHYIQICDRLYTDGLRLTDRGKK